MKSIFPFLLFFYFVTNLSATNPINLLRDNDALRNANISLLVLDINTGAVVSELNSKQSFVPASTMKLITVATALELLGADFQFETKLQIDGKIDEHGVLNGNLYIRGGGDPTLGSEFIGNRDFLKLWLSAVKQAGIKSVNGGVIADAGLFDTEGVNPQWSWEDIANYYAPGIYGISYKDNMARVHFYSGEAGSVPRIIKTVPKIPDIGFGNYLRSTAIRNDSAYFYGAPHSNLRYIYGQIPANRDNFIAKMDIPNPAIMLAQHFRDALISEGVSVVYPPTDQVIESQICKTIYTHRSPLLKHIVKEINFNSNNHYAEHVFRYLALQSATTATTNGALQVIRNFLKSKNLPVEQLFMYDGSGLSRANAVSAEFYVCLLTYMKAQSPNSEVFYNSLPVAGKSGSIERMLKNTSLQGKVRAKSGSFSRVRAYAGYIDTENKNYAFAIIVNNYYGRPDAVIKEIEKYLLNVVR